MKQPEIIVTINGQSYRLCTSDVDSMSNIPEADRQQLIALLETVKRVGEPSQSPTQQVAAKVSESPQGVTTTKNASATLVNREKSPERLRSGDVDAVMAQLAMEEDLNKKPALTKHTIHKVIAITAVIIILLILIL